MKTVLVFLAVLISSSYAGVGVLSPQDEHNALALFHRICTHNNREGGADIEGFTVFCKSARDDVHEETLTHQVHVPPEPPRPATVVFVSPPAVRYRHQIILKGSPGTAQASKIYVLPQKATHQIAATFNPSAHNPNVKPMVFFLKNNFGQHNDNHPHQQPSQGPQYGPGLEHQNQQEVQYGPPLAIAPHPQYGVVDVAPQQPHQEQGYSYPHPSQVPIEGGGVSGGYA